MSARAKRALVGANYEPIQHFCGSEAHFRQRHIACSRPLYLSPNFRYQPIVRAVRFIRKNLAVSNLLRPIVARSVPYHMCKPHWRLKTLFMCAFFAAQEQLTVYVQCISSPDACVKYAPLAQWLERLGPVPVASLTRNRSHVRSIRVPCMEYDAFNYTSKLFGSIVFPRSGREPTTKRCI